MEIDGEENNMDLLLIVIEDPPDIVRSKSVDNYEVDRKVYLAS